MKQASIGSFFKRSATASDDLIRPAKKKIKGDSSSQASTTSKKDEQKEEDQVATPPIPESPPSPRVKFSDDDDDGADTEEDEDLQEQVKKSIARRSQSMPEHALKAAIHTNNTRDEDANKGGNANKYNGVEDGTSATPKIDKSKSRLVMQHNIGSQVIQIRQGDITEECTGAIVNAANSSLAHGGGVAGAISRKGGPQIQQESDKWVRKNGTVPSGKVAITGAGDLPCTSVIHAVGPVWTGGKRGEDKELYGAVWQSLLKAHQLNLASISIPAISSGIFGFPKDRCAYIMTECAVKFCAKYGNSPVKEIRFTNFDRETIEIFTTEFRNRFHPADGENEEDGENEANGVNGGNEPDGEDGGSEHENNHQTTTTTIITTSKNNKSPTNKTSNSTFKSSPKAKTKTKKVDDNDGGDETEEDESMVQPTGYESSDSEAEDNSISQKIQKSSTKDRSTSRHDDDNGESSDSDVEWDKWRK